MYESDLEKPEESFPEFVGLQTALGGIRFPNVRRLEFPGKHSYNLVYPVDDSAPFTVPDPSGMDKTKTPVL